MRFVLRVAVGAHLVTAEHYGSSVFAKAPVCSKCPGPDVDSQATKALSPARDAGPCSTGRGRDGYAFRIPSASAANSGGIQQIAVPCLPIGH
jgi:hypothetical protein